MCVECVCVCVCVCVWRESDNRTFADNCLHLDSRGVSFSLTHAHTQEDALDAYESVSLKLFVRVCVCVCEGLERGERTTCPEAASNMCVCVCVCIVVYVCVCVCVCLYVWLCVCL